MNRWQIIAIVVAVTIGFTAMVMCMYYKGILPAGKNDSKGIHLETMIEEQEEPQKGPLMGDFPEPFENAEWVTVEKVERTTTDYQDGDSKTTYETYVFSDVYLDKQIDYTEDYADVLASESEPQSVSFADAFGFSYKGMNGYEILTELLRINGVDGDLNEVNYDKETYEITKQRIYELENDSTVLSKMLDGVIYDEVMESKVFYETMSYRDGIVIPDCFTAVVQYRNGDEVITKSMFLQVSINDVKEGDAEDEV